MAVADATMLDRALDAAWPASRAGLSRPAFGRFHAALTKTRWGAASERSVVLKEGRDVVAGAERYDLAAVLDGRAVRVCGIGSVFTTPGHGETDGARRLVDHVLAQAARDGAQMALIFSGADDPAPADFAAIPLTDVTLEVAAPPHHGAPMTMVRAGEERDFAAMVAMGRARAGGVRFHLDRDADFVQHAITRKRLLAGLGPAHARQLHFFIAEEGITAAAYVVVSVEGPVWTLEECGDRDASGARVGALLQALIAREPIERRPSIHAWLPPGFLPPQVTIASSSPAARTLRVGMLDSSAITPPLSSTDVLYWRNDLL